MKYKFIVFLVYLHLCSAATQAQTCCSAGAPITSSFDINVLSERQFSFQMGYEYNSVNLLIDNNKKLVNDPRKRNGHNLLFKTDFVLHKNWAFSVFIPIVLQNRKTFSETENAVGLGDLTLLSQYTRYISGELSIKGSAGIKFPTGNQYITDDRGINLSPDMQSGSGTFDFIGRIAISKQHIFIRNLSNQTSISFRYNSTNEHFGDRDKVGGRSFKFGNEVQFTTAFSYLLVAKYWFIIPELGVQVRHVSPNQEEETDAPNSGGYWFRIPVALQLQPNERFSIRPYGEIPVMHALNGLQITTNYKVGIQFYYFF